jgi:hypothetical protein
MIVSVVLAALAAAAFHEVAVAFREAVAEAAPAVAVVAVEGEAEAVLAAAKRPSATI